MADKNQQQATAQQFSAQQQMNSSKIDALYSWLSYDLQKLKKELLNEVKTASAQTSESAKTSSKMVAQEIRYSYVQNQTIYDGLSELISDDVEQRKQAMAELKKAIDEILPQYQATAQEVKYSFVQQQAIYDTIMDKVEKLESIDAMLAELDRKGAEVLSLVEDYKASMETLTEKAEESVATHTREVLDAIGAIPVAENVDYTRIVDEVGDRVLELLGEVMQASSADKVEAKVDYDKVIYGTAEKVVESLPITEKIDYARLEDIMSKKAEVDYDKLSDMIVAKMAANTAQKYDVKLDEESIDQIADKVIEKMGAMEKPEEEVTYDFVIDEEGIENIAERVAEKLEGKCFVTAPAYESAVEEPVAEEPVVEEPVVEEPVVEASVAEEIAPSAEPTYDEVNDQLVDADTGLVIRLKKSFTAKMKQSEDRIKGYYSDIKNALKSYKRINSNVSWHGDRFNLGRDTIAKMNICGKTLCLYLALNPEDEELKQTVYHQKNVGEQKAYENTPFMVKVKSDGAAKKAVRLVGILAEKLEAQKIEDYEVADFTAEFAYETTKQLLDEGFIKLTKEKQVELNF